MRGRSLLAGGLATAVCAVVLDERDLLRVAVVVAVLPLLSLLAVAVTRRALRTSREITPHRLPVGTRASVSVALTGGPLVGALRVADAVPDAAGPQPDAPPRFTVHRLPAGRGVTLPYPLRPVLRGAHRIGPLVARVQDPLGLAEMSREFGTATRLLALPAVVDLHGLPTSTGGEGTPGAAVSHQGAGEPDVMVRSYRPGDELRRVHWRATARHDELMVRLEERPWRGELTVLLDHRGGAHRGHGAGSSLEFAVSLAASICAHLARHGEPVTLVTEDGTTIGGARPAGAASGPAVGGLDPLLDVLAELRPSAASDLAGPPLVTSGGLVAILGDPGPGGVGGLLTRHPIAGHAVLLDVATWDDAPAGSATAGAATALRAAGWRVTTAAAGTDPRRCWAALAGGSGGAAFGDLRAATDGPAGTAMRTTATVGAAGSGSFPARTAGHRGIGGGTSTADRAEISSTGALGAATGRAPGDSPAGTPTRPDGSGSFAANGAPGTGAFTARPAIADDDTGALPVVTGGYSPGGAETTGPLPLHRPGSPAGPEAEHDTTPGFPRPRTNR